MEQKSIKIDEKYNLNKVKMEEIDDKQKDLEKSIKDLNFQVRNYYCVSNKIAGLLEKLGANPSTSEVSKLLLGSQTNTINTEPKINNVLPVSPQPKKRIINKNLNLDLLKMDLDSSPGKSTLNTKRNQNKSVANYAPRRNSMLNSIGLKKMKFLGLNNSDSASSKSSSLDLNATIKKIDDNKNKENLKPILKPNSKQLVSNIKQNIKENNKENAKVSFKNNNKENSKINLKDNNKEKLNTSRTEISSKNSEKIEFKNRIKILPILTLGKKESKEDNTLEIKRVNLSSLSFEKMTKENKTNTKNLIMVVNNDNKTKQNYQKKINAELEHDQQGTKVVTLSLPQPNPLLQPSINIIKKESDINSKGKYNVVNCLINDYRAKLFSKAHSSEARINLTNEILDIPKKVTQAFGRTTYTFYFKKDAIDRTNANNNINNFGYDGPKKPYKFKISKRSDTGSYK